MTDCDSDSDEEDLLFPMKGPIVMCSEEEEEKNSSAPSCLSDIHHLELCFLRQDVDAIQRILGRSGIVPEEEKIAIEMTIQILEGDFIPLITSPCAPLSFSSLFGICTDFLRPEDVLGNIRSAVFSYIRGEESKSKEIRIHEWKCLQILLLGYAYFMLFCQVNYTGPELSMNAKTILSTASGSSSLENARVLQILECDGNYAFPICELPFFLAIARCLTLTASYPSRAGWQAGIELSSTGEIVVPKHDGAVDAVVLKAVRGLCSRYWLSSRVLQFHLRLLQKQNYTENMTLFKEMQDMYSDCEKEIGYAIRQQNADQEACSNNGAINGIVPKNSHLISLLYLEHGLQQHFFDHGDKGKDMFQKAMRRIGLEVKLTAALGKRTKFQQIDHAQLLLLAKSGLLSDQAEYNLSKTLEEADMAMYKCFGGKPKGEDANSNQWQHSEWELGTKIAIKNDENGEEAIIRDVKLDSMDGGAAENILLEERIKFTSNDAALDNNNLRLRNNVLHPLEQAIVLALCLDVSNSNPSNDVLTAEEMFPYLQSVINMYHNHQHILECQQKVAKKNEMLQFNSMGKKIEAISFEYDKAKIENCLNWMVYSTTLLERSMLEFEKRRTMDRAMMQMQALLDQHTTRLTVHQNSRQVIEEAAPAQVRLRYLPCLVYPSRWELKRELAQQYLKSQVFNSALELFTELEMWDEVVACYQLLQKPKRAEMLVRERISNGEETPYMVCALADLTASEELYEKSWRISGKRFGRAKRTLARLCFDQSRYEECCAHLDEALRVQPLASASWYLKGIACMRIENYSGALASFTRCVQQDTEIGEAWGNLAAIHMHSRRFERAYECLQEAKKHRSREWRLTENLLTVCLETGRYLECLECMRQLLELRHLKSAALEASSLGNHVHGADTTREHPTPVHLPHLQRLGAIVAARTVQFAQERLSGGESGGHDGAKGMELPRLTREFESFLGKILNTMHSDAVYYELLVGYHELLCSQGAEGWLVLRSRELIREYRTKEFRVLLNQPGWEKDEAKVRELGKVGQALAKCYFQSDDQPLPVTKGDVFTVKSMFKTAKSRLEQYVLQNKQFEVEGHEDILAALDDSLMRCSELEERLE